MRCRVAAPELSRRPRRVGCLDALATVCCYSRAMQVCSTAYTDSDGERKFLPQYFRFSVANPVAVRTKARCGAASCALCDGAENGSCALFLPCLSG